jgi:hypothetical protein
MVTRQDRAADLLLLHQLLIFHCLSVCVQNEYGLVGVYEVEISQSVRIEVERTRGRGMSGWDRTRCQSVNHMRETSVASLVDQVLPMTALGWRRVVCREQEMIPGDCESSSKISEKLVWFFERW